MPCPTATEAAQKKQKGPGPPEKKRKSSHDCPDGCNDCRAMLSAKLQQLARAINEGSLGTNGSREKPIEAKDLEALIQD